VHDFHPLRGPASAAGCGRPAGGMASSRTAELAKGGHDLIQMLNLGWEIPSRAVALVEFRSHRHGRGFQATAGTVRGLHMRDTWSRAAVDPT
jgi:hypothetical protein